MVKQTSLEPSHPKKQPAARPFLKWAGGKTQLLDQFSNHFPLELVAGNITRYVEPFLGGGALFLDLVGRFSIEEAYLWDINAELVLAYRVVQREPQALIDYLLVHERDYLSLADDGREAYFYSIRDAYNDQRYKIDYNHFSDEWVRRAGYMLFLNKTCFNGLYRVNRKAAFNVPFGRYKRPAILDQENILRVSQSLQIAQIRVGSFEECQPYVNKHTFVYFDPPYRPISATSNFTSYSKDKFDDDDQRRLGAFFSSLHDGNGAKLMLSNSDPKNYDEQDTFFDELYGTYNIHRVQANRMINSNAAKRGKITELLVTNY